MRKKFGINHVTVQAECERGMNEDIISSDVDD